MDTLFQIESFEAFKSAVNELINNLYCYQQLQSNEIESSVFAKSKQDIRLVISECDFDADKIAELFDSKGWDSERIKYFLNIFEKQKTKLLYTAINHHNSSYGDTLRDFDWLLKIIIGTSELKTLKFSLLQLKLWSVNSNGDQKKVMYDINKNMLLKVIGILENINE